MEGTILYRLLCTLSSLVLFITHLKKVQQTAKLVPVLVDWINSDSVDAEILCYLLFSANHGGIMIPKVQSENEISRC